MENSQFSTQTVLISFSGVDGAGKSTQIANLCTLLEQAGLSVKKVAFWDDVATLKSLREEAGHRIFKGDKGVGSPDAPIERRDKNVRSPAMTLIRLGMYILDAFSLRRKVKGVLRSGSSVVIFDRYIYDELANLNLRHPIIRIYLELMLRLVPQPQIAFILDADPVQARLRKPEYPLQWLRENRRAYLWVSDFLGTAAVIPPLPLEEATAQVARRVWECKTLRVPTRTQQPPAVIPEGEMDEHEAHPLAS